MNSLNPEAKRELRREVDAEREQRRRDGMLRLSELRTEDDLNYLNPRVYAELAGGSVTKLDLYRMQLQHAESFRLLVDQVEEAMARQ